MTDQQREHARADAKNLLDLLRVMEDQDHLALNREGQRNAIEILTALLDELDRQEQHNELGSDREHARDQLEAATVRTYQQIRTDQEHIAELELQLEQANYRANYRANYLQHEINLMRRTMQTAGTWDQFCSDYAAYKRDIFDRSSKYPEET